MSEKRQRAIRPDAQAFDEVHIVTIPRYKTSGLSGDEWRISAEVRFYRKRQLCHTARFRNIETACGFLYAEHAKACDEGKAFFAGEDNHCDQEGCMMRAKVTLQKKADYCHCCGNEQFGSIQSGVRKFCNDHKVRGDCGIDDADRNYEPLTSQDGDR